MSLGSAPDRSPGVGQDPGPHRHRLLGQRLRPDFLVRAGSELERAQAIMVDTWKRAGLDVQTTVQPDIALPLIERSNFPNLQAQTHTFDKFNYWATSDIGTAANGWRGDNRAGWSNPPPRPGRRARSRARPP